MNQIWPALRRAGPTLLKLAITAAGLFVVLRTVDLAIVGQTLRGADWRWLGLATLLALLGYVVRAWRWFVLLRGLGAQLPFARVVRLYFVGGFFSTILPGGSGGDAVRIVEAAQDTPASVAAGTVLVDRLTGLMVQFAIVLLALPFRPTGFAPALVWSLVALALVILVVGALLLDGRLIRRWQATAPAGAPDATWRRLWRLSPRGHGPVAQVLQAVAGSGRPAIATAFLASLVLTLMVFGWWTLVGVALGTGLTFRYAVLVVPVMSAALLLPSIGGLGTREALAPLLFAGAGLSPGEAVALSFLVLVVERSVSLVGAPLYLVSALTGRRKTNDRPLTAEE